MQNLTSTTDAPEVVTAALGAPASKETSSEASAAAAQTKDESAADSETADETTDADEVTEAAGDDDKKPKKGGGFQKRISKLTGDRDRLAEENQALKRQLAGNAPAAKPAEAQKPAAPPEAPQYDKPKPKLEDFETLESYTEAVSDWKSDERDFKRTQADQARQAHAETQKLVDTWRTREAEAKAAYDDYDAAIQAVSHIRISPQHQRAILECEHGPEIAYELAKNPDELKRIAAMSPLNAARALGRLEAKFASSDEPSTAPKTETKASAAPKPIKPVNAGSKTSASTKNPDQMSYREYCAWREKR